MVWFICLRGVEWFGYKGPDRQEKDITSLTSLLSLSRAASTLVLLHHNWNFETDEKQAWFEDEDKVREAVGLLPAPGPVLGVESPNNSGRIKCRICLEVCASQKMKSAGCGHLFCCECWGSYIGISIADGPGCLMLRCPDPACRVAIAGDMIETFCSDEYSYYLRRSYIEGSKVSWSRPVECRTLKEWILKNSSEAENTNWILANSKPCPKCKRAIEKNQGCMHMYEKAKTEGAYSEEEMRREMAKNSLEKYSHYFERWQSNQSSRQKALEDLHQTQTVNTDKVRDNQRTGEGEGEAESSLEDFINVPRRRYSRS
ncbi:hypothetical protein ACLB2K_031790 [Fragaria x ananassa]